MEDFQYLVEAEKLDITKTLSSRDELDTTEKILDRLNLPNKKRAQKLEALECILANLLYGHLIGKPISYYRDKNHYGLPRRYGKDFYTYDNVVRIVDRLEEAGFIEGKKGFHDLQGKSFISRMWPTQRLVDLVGYCDLANKPIKELILLRDQDKNYLDYEDTASISRMREQLKQYNDLINQIQIKLVIPSGVRLKDESFQDLRRKYPRAFSNLNQYNNQNINSVISKHCELLTYSSVIHPVVFPLSIVPYLSLSEFTLSSAPFHYSGEISPMYTDEVHYPLEHVQTYRVFNRGHFGAGGRFYNKGLRSYNGLSKELRSYMTLNGHRVVELDYSGLHIRFSYHLKKIDYQEDPYGFSGKDKSAREPYKLAALIMLNSNERQRAVKAIRMKFLEKGIPLLKDAEINEVMDRVLEKHSLIAECFFRDKGAYFMNIDARIMEGILSHFTERGVPVLPVHDSCVVARQFEQDLREVMMEEYRKVMGFEPVIG